VLASICYLCNSCVGPDMHGDVPFRLEPAGDAKRNRAIAAKGILAGNVILSNRPLSTVLVPYQKGRRCDYCLRRVSSTLRCSACKEYWYCDQRCTVTFKPHCASQIRQNVVFSTIRDPSFLLALTVFSTCFRPHTIPVFIQTQGFTLYYEH